MHAEQIVAICGLLTAGFLCQFLAWRTKVPVILFLLATGILVGPVLQLFDPDALFGELLVPSVSIAVAVILFEGALTLRFSDLRGHGRVVARLVSVGVLVTWVGSALSAWWVLQWNPLMAILFGAIVTVSGPTVVMPILRSVRPNKSIAGVLRWEGILIDPVGAILALLVFEFIIAAQVSTGILHTLQNVVVISLGGTVLGSVGGFLFGQAIRRRLIPDFLRDYAALASVLVVYATAESLSGESGLLAVTVMGIWLANLKDVDLGDVLEFKESLTLLLVASIFILLAARIDLQAVFAIGVGALLVVLLLQFVVGPLRAFVCSFGSELTLRERFYIGWVFPRGIVAAAISAVFAIRLSAEGFPGADSLVPLVFSVIVGTVFVQSLTARALAKGLDVAEPDPKGVLIVGSNRAALAIANELKELEIPVLVSDTHWASINKARLEGLRTYFGSVVSRHADRNLDITGLGNLLAMSRRPGINELACVRYASEFGSDSVFTLGNQSEGEHQKHRISGERMGRMLYGGEYVLSDLVRKVSAGDVPKSTKLTEEFTYEDYCKKHPEALMLFSVDDEENLHFPVGDEKFEPEPGWLVCSLLPPENGAATNGNGPGNTAANGFGKGAGVA